MGNLFSYEEEAQKNPPSNNPPPPVANNNATVNNATINNATVNNANVSDANVNNSGMSQSDNAEIEVEEKVFETEMKTNALNVTSNRIEIIIKHPDKHEDLNVKFIPQKDEGWMVFQDEIYRKSSDSEEWRHVELYSSGRYFERQMTFAERKKFTKLMEEIVTTLQTNGNKYITLLREIVKNTDDYKLAEFTTHLDMNKLV